ncbi:MAG: D-alanyl-D-alanine dipeptidase [Pseudohongiellaceae bacterium]|jgi:D-alanyl-D-alanine dipeptidase
MRYIHNLLVFRGVGSGLCSGLALIQGPKLNQLVKRSIALALEFAVASRALILIITALLTLTACGSLIPANTPAGLGFVNLADFMMRNGQALEVDVRYLGTDNFVGARVDGYAAEKIYMTREAAAALLTVQKKLKTQGLGLKVFDAYRPQQAVDHFVRWAEDLGDARMKVKYYPHVNKENLFRDGYIASRSGHSRGSTVDLTLVTLTDNAELDMGTSWDFFDPLSWPSNDQVSQTQRANRDYLADVMIRAGFRPLIEEWWHFTLDEEPYLDRYFNFKVE